MGRRAPTGMRFKRLRQYRRNFERVFSGHALEQHREVQRYLRVRRWSRITLAAAGAVAAIAAWWWLVLR